MLHYAFSFFLSSLFIVVINIIYMQSYVYRDEELYHFDPQPYLREIEAGITRNEYNQVIIKPDLAERLENRGIGIQLINTDLFEVIRAGMVPDEIRMSYTLSQLMALYESDLVTTFVSETQSESTHYTVLMFLDPKQVKRMLYTYDVKRVGAAYNLSWLVGMNLILLLLISYIYTYSIIRPVHRIIERILTLAQGQYTSQEPVKGMYAKVVRSMNQLATQLETARQQRALADAAQEEWIVNLSHDIKTPLTSMIGYAELLGDTDYKLETEERVLYKQYIQEKGRYIKALLSDLNLATRLKHHPYPLRLEQVNLIGVIKTELIKALNTSAIDNSRHTVAFTHSHEYVDVMLDLHLFERAFTNLIHNAFVHNEAPVSVKVHVDAHDEESISIIIDDDGVGVKPEELHLIFTRYYRGTSTNTIREGSGLGLAIAKNIIEAHEGTIVPEKSPRGGLKITIYLRRLKNEKPS